MQWYLVFVPTASQRRKIFVCLKYQLESLYWSKKLIRIEYLNGALSFIIYGIYTTAVFFATALYSGAFWNTTSQNHSLGNEDRFRFTFILFF